MTTGGRMQEARGRGQEAGGRRQGIRNTFYVLRLTSHVSRFTSHVSRLSLPTPYSLLPSYLGPFFAFVIFPLALLWRPLFAGQAFFWGTPLLQFVPWQRMAAAMWQGGHLPLWNPLVGCGAPLAANYQTAAFYPLNALHLLLPAEVALSWTTALHMALTGWGMYHWARAVGLDRFPAFIGALALEGSGFLVARVALFPSIALAFPWLAIWLWRAEVLVQTGRLRDGLWLGLTLGLGLLAGHAQTVFYGGLLLAAYLVFRAVQETRISRHARSTQRAARSRSSFIRRSALAALSLAVGLGLAAVQLLPTATLLIQSQRQAGVAYDFAMTYSMWPWRLITFVAPNLFGNPNHGDYWGYATYWEDAGYVGVLPLLLILGTVLGKRHSRGRKKEGDTEAGQVMFWAIVVVVTLILALGKNTPVFPFLFRHVPTFDLFRAPARWLAATTIALAALTALGAQRWPVGHHGRRKGALAGVIGGALTIGGLAAPRLVSDMPSTFAPATARLGVTLAMAGALTLLQRDTGWWRTAAAAFIALDLLLFGWPLVPAIDRELYHGTTRTAEVLQGEPSSIRVYWPTDPASPTSEYDSEHRVKFSYFTFKGFGPSDVNHWWKIREILLPNGGMLDHLASANNFDPLLVGRYVDLLQAAVEASELLRVMGVTHIVSDQPWPGGEPIHKAKAATLYHLPDAPGRAWIVPSARRVPLDEMLAALTNPAFDLTAEVLLEVDPPFHRDSQSLPRNSHIMTLQETPNRVTIRATLSAPGYLVLADTWDSGWHVAVDGVPQELLRANYAFRAVGLESGEHTVEMIYRPPSVFVGRTVTLSTLVLLAVGLLLTRRGEE